MFPRVPKFILLGLAALAAVSPPPAAEACDSSSCLLVTRGQNGLLGKGALRVDVTFRSTPMTELLHGSDPADQVLRPKLDFENRRLLPGFHDELGGRDRFLHVDLAYGLGGRTALFASMPVVTDRAFDIGHAPVRRETYSTTGNGDALLGVRYGFFQRAHDSLVGGLSLEVPLGRHTLTAPADRVDRGILDPILQPGSGSVDLGATLQYARRISGSWNATLAASYQVYTTNDLDYRAGSDTIASVTVSRPLFGPVGGSVQVKGLSKDRSDFMDAPLQNTGGRFVYLVPGLSVRAPLQMDALRVRDRARLPLRQRGAAGPAHGSGAGPVPHVLDRPDTDRLVDDEHALEGHGGGVGLVVEETGVDGQVLDLERLACLQRDVEDAAAGVVGRVLVGEDRVRLVVHVDELHLARVEDVEHRGVDAGSPDRHLGPHRLRGGQVARGRSGDVRAAAAGQHQGQGGRRERTEAHDLILAQNGHVSARRS